MTENNDEKRFFTKKLGLSLEEDKKLLQETVKMSLSTPKLIFLGYSDYLVNEIYNLLWDMRTPLGITFVTCADTIPQIDPSLKVSTTHVRIMETNKDSFINDYRADGFVFIFSSSTRLRTVP